MKTTFNIMMRIMVLLSVVLFFNCSNISPENDSLEVTHEAKLEQEYVKKIAEYKKEVDLKIEVVDTQIGKLDSLIKDWNESKIGFIFLVIILNIIVISLILIGVLIWFLNSKKFKNIIVKKVVNSQKVEDMINTKLHQHKKPQSYYNLKPEDIKLIGERVIKYMDSLQPKKTDLEIKESQIQENNTAEHNTKQKNIHSSPSKYLRGISDNKFKITDSSPGGSFFRIINENNDSAQFEFYGIEAEAIAKRVFIDDISNIVSGSYQGAESVKTITPGELKRVDDHWEVTKSIEIKLS